MPTSPIPPFKLGEKTDDPLQMYLADIFTVSVNLAGLPGVSVPCGFTEGSQPLPIGFQVIGRMFDEATMLRWRMRMSARPLEQERRARVMRNANSQCKECLCSFFAFCILHFELGSGGMTDMNRRDWMMHVTASVWHRASARTPRPRRRPPSTRRNGFPVSSRSASRPAAPRSTASSAAQVRRFCCSTARRSRTSHGGSWHQSSPTHGRRRRSPRLRRQQQARRRDARTIRSERWRSIRSR